MCSAHQSGSADAESCRGFEMRKLLFMFLLSAIWLSADIIRTPVTDCNLPGSAQYNACSRLFQPGGPIPNTGPIPAAVLAPFGITALGREVASPNSQWVAQGAANIPDFDSVFVDLERWYLVNRSVLRQQWFGVGAGCHK